MAPAPGLGGAEGVRGRPFDGRAGRGLATRAGWIEPPRGLPRATAVLVAALGHESTSIATGNPVEARGYTMHAFMVDSLSAYEAMISSRIESASKRGAGPE
jgi:hypothetical protein